jgi:hypothetical protein
MILQYGGYRYIDLQADRRQLTDNYPYIPFLHTVTEHSMCANAIYVDIPKGYGDTWAYNGTLAHKTNHSFLPTTSKTMVIT